MTDSQYRETMKATTEDHGREWDASRQGQRRDEVRAGQFGVVESGGMARGSTEAPIAFPDSEPVPWDTTETRKERLQPTNIAFSDTHDG